VPTEQLQIMVKNLRAECGHSLAVAQGVNSVDTLKYLLQRTQEELWTAFVWPELTIRAEVVMAPGQYQYPYPATMGYDQIRETWYAFTTDASWMPVDYGIGEDAIKPGGGNSWRADPVQAWDTESTTQFRVWPTPDQSGGTLRFKGNKLLGAFSADADLCTLDDNVIVLFAAAEILARAKAEDAAGKMQKAQRHLQKLLGNKISAKRRVSTLGGGSPVRKVFALDPLSRSTMYGG
jgi:hypothetical protein